MKNEEVNKIIAEFMGLEFDIMPCGGNAVTIPLKRNQSRLIFNYYTESLDALVPVWEKMKREFKTEFMLTIFDFNGNPWNCEFELEDYSIIEEESESAHFSASHATAKAILELKK